MVLLFLFYYRISHFAHLKLTYNSRVLQPSLSTFSKFRERNIVIIESLSELFQKKKREDKSENKESLAIFLTHFFFKIL